jgi:hypothetical protein
MKLKLTGTFVFLMMLTMHSFGQYTSPKTSLNIPLGYTFDDRVQLDDFSTRIEGGFQFGGGLEFFTSPNKSLDISYQYMATKMPLYGVTGNQLNKGYEDGNVQYILLNGNNYFASKGNKIPFIGGGAGLGITKTDDQSSAALAFNFKAGVKIATQKTLAFKLQAYIQGMTGVFGSDYWGSGGNVVVVPDRATILQFGLGGVVCFDFRGK